jgi:hypothetical protein
MLRGTGLYNDEARMPSDKGMPNDKASLTPKFTRRVSPIRASSLVCHSSFRFRHCVQLPRSRRQSPQPDAENAGDDERDPAYTHWDRVRSDGDLGLVDQAQQMANGKNTEKHARNAQSSFW